MPDTAQEITRTPVIVWSEGSRLAAEVIRPAGDDGAPRPAILLCHGWAGLKSHLAEAYAVPFARAGYVCLVFDYRGWGESDGRMISTPDSPMLLQEGEQTAKVTVIRNLVDPLDQVADIRACFEWLTVEPGVDPARIGLWGSSYGGGHVVVVAGTDERPKAVVAQIGGYGAPEPPPEFRAAARAAGVQKARAQITPPMPQPGNVETVPGLRGVPDVARILFHNPIRAAEGLKAPTLFLDAEFEEYATPETHGLVAEVAKRHVTSERITYPCTHYEVYDKFLEPARAKALEWFGRYL